MLGDQQLVLVAGSPWNETVQDKSMLAAVTGCAVAKPEWVAACIQVQDSSPKISRSLAVDQACCSL